MSELARFQATFAAALLDPEQPQSPRAELADADWRPRLAVYRNNVVTALADAVVKSYPAVERLVGLAFLRGAAIAFVRAHPPAERALTLALGGFSDFLRGFPPARDLPYAADVAAIDRAWLEALYASDAAALTADALEDLPPDDVAVLAPGLAPSVRLMASAFPAYTIWTMNRGEAPLAPIALEAGGETALVWRSGYAAQGSSVRHRRLAPGEAVFVGALQAGASLGDAGAAASGADPDFNLADAFARLLADGVLGRDGNSETTP